MYALLEVVGSFLLGRRPVRSFSKYELRHLKTPTSTVDIMINKKTQGLLSGSFQSSVRIRRKIMVPASYKCITCEGGTSAVIRA